jgi:chorismate dehydratase
MKIKEETTARIGMVNFINTAPLYEIWQQTVHRDDWQVTEAPPSVLNSMLFDNELDLGFVSSHEYAAHPEQYKILSDLSISATGPVGSVFLFSEVDFEKLNDRLILLSSHSQTSVSLVKIILEEFYAVTPRYVTGKTSEIGDELLRPAAVLAIGDEALRLASGDDFPFRLDLSEAWQKETGLPFVFAVWAVREDFCKRDADTVVAVHQELLRCIQEGREQLKEISAKVAPRIPMDIEACFDYLQGVEYDLSPEKLQALTLFFEYLIKRGEAPVSALPIKVCG